MQCVWWGSGLMEVMRNAVWGGGSGLLEVMRNAVYRGFRADGSDARVVFWQ